MTREYENYNKHFECFVYDRNKLVLHLIFYKPTNYGYPRYHFENFALHIQQLNYEICRFMRVVNKVMVNPKIDTEQMALDSSLEEMWQH